MADPSGGDGCREIRVRVRVAAVAEPSGEVRVRVRLALIPYKVGIIECFIT